MDVLSFDFMQNALAAGLLASLICGVIGTLVVVNRIVFISGGIAHASYGGVGLAFLLGLPVLPVTAAFTVCMALIMALVTLHARERVDTVIGVIWASGMALGIILLDLTPGYNVDLMSYLFGSILAVPRSDLWIMAAMAAVVAVMVLVFYRGFTVMSFDEEFARSRGVPVDFLYILLIVMVGLCVVMIIRVVGLILVIALLTIPPFIAERRTRSLKVMMLVSTLLSALFTVTGLFFSYALDLTSGASIIAVAAIGFFVSLLIPQKNT
ncbi:iron chelate uptake ABC transporter family permease subunit [Pseudodesulfovibrio thermohalotolerans]|uniref:metal ABC transporter permease n=1 Tax=Pseudodesulfovibrio thermohalotolerans TaxID=2880651 RepID=UPI00244287BD|nr:iron chelate uptake ABC transporter family permease subunit [Pseudodesulfovibrio thermohalotolerans]WFS63541.1 iron chelate uptake ABC transporter family permease subunit [Pseudodesulfovibrio thermohalotolerans]